MSRYPAKNLRAGLSGLLVASLLAWAAPALAAEPPGSGGAQDIAGQNVAVENEDAKQEGAQRDGTQNGGIQDDAAEAVTAAGGAGDSTTETSQEAGTGEVDPGAVGTDAVDTEQTGSEESVASAGVSGPAGSAGPEDEQAKPEAGTSGAPPAADTPATDAPSTEGIDKDGLGNGIAEADTLGAGSLGISALSTDTPSSGEVCAAAEGELVGVDGVTRHCDTLAALIALANEDPAYRTSTLTMAVDAVVPRFDVNLGTDLTVKGRKALTTDGAHVAGVLNFTGTINAVVDGLEVLEGGKAIITGHVNGTAYGVSITGHSSIIEVSGNVTASAGDGLRVFKTNKSVEVKGTVIASERGVYAVGAQPTVRIFVGKGVTAAGSVGVQTIDSAQVGVSGDITALSGVGASSIGGGGVNVGGSVIAATIGVEAIGRSTMTVNGSITATSGVGVRLDDRSSLRVERAITAATNGAEISNSAWMFAYGGITAGSGAGIVAVNGHVIEVTGQVTGPTYGLHVTGGANPTRVTIKGTVVSPATGVLVAEGSGEEGRNIIQIRDGITAGEVGIDAQGLARISLEGPMVTAGTFIRAASDGGGGTDLGLDDHGGVPGCHLDSWCYTDLAPFHDQGVSLDWRRIAVVESHVLNLPEQLTAADMPKVLAAHWAWVELDEHRELSAEVKAQTHAAWADYLRQAATINHRAEHGTLAGLDASLWHIDFQSAVIDHDGLAPLPGALAGRDVLNGWDFTSTDLLTGLPWQPAAGQPVKVYLTGFTPPADPADMSAGILLADGTVEDVELGVDADGWFVLAPHFSHYVVHVAAPLTPPEETEEPGESTPGESTPEGSVPGGAGEDKPTEGTGPETNVGDEVAEDDGSGEAGPGESAAGVVPATASVLPVTGMAVGGATLATLLACLLGVGAVLCAVGARNARRP